MKTQSSRSPTRETQDEFEHRLVDNRCATRLDWMVHQLIDLLFIFAAILSQRYTPAYGTVAVSLPTNEESQGQPYADQ